MNIESLNFYGKISKPVQLNNTDEGRASHRSLVNFSTVSNIFDGKS